MRDELMDHFGLFRESWNTWFDGGVWFDMVDVSTSPEVSERVVK
jgi:hypothetical protein